MVFLHWLTGALLRKQLSFPVDFVYSVHSQNPVGARNVAGLMGNLLREFALSCK
jgi:hypothetical protein